MTPKQLMPPPYDPMYVNALLADARLRCDDSKPWRVPIPESHRLLFLESAADYMSGPITTLVTKGKQPIPLFSPWYTRRDRE